MNETGSMFFGGGFMWIFWILIIVFIVYVIKAGMGNSTDDNNSNESPLEILKKRYARGEIDEQEYERRRKELES